MRILIAIIHKITSPNILTNYSNVLDAISNAFQKNLSENEIKSFISMQLSDMKSWNIKLLVYLEALEQIGHLQMDLMLLMCIQIWIV